jgi:hypothetical protein
MIKSGSLIPPRPCAPKVWNVSQDQPLRSFKTVGGMVQGIVVFPPQQQAEGAGTWCSHAEVA